MQIGNLTIEGRVVLAPMAGITDQPFRRLCRRFGAALVYTEFLSSDGMIVNSRKQEHKLALADDEHPVAYQLFGSRTKTFGMAAVRLSRFHPDLIDLNFGCPVKKVVRNNGGSAILKDLNLMGDIVRETCAAVAIPVSVKMRAGWDHDNLVYRDAAQVAVDAGAQAVTLHARTRADAYQHPARWEYIRDLKTSLSVPLIGNGDVDSPEAAKEMLEQTGCDAVMVGRAALGRPWIFTEINHYLETGALLPQPRITDCLSVAWGHLTDKISQMSREDATIRHMRKQLASYFKGLPDASQVRGPLMQLESLTGIRDLMQRYVRNHPPGERVENDDWIGNVVFLDRSWLNSTTISIN